ncbi:MAG: ABC transporter substrate-binding protein, partial [Varibaculum cambriense]|nr:ABC transporter substrate-binding protein [Varibaculum cambriense]
MRKIATALACTLALTLAGCATGSSSATRDPELKNTSVILDWTPNTNHTGIYVAQEKGFYREAGLNVKVVPFSKSGVESVMAAKGADFGFSGTDSIASAKASNLGIKMVFNLQPKSSYMVGFLDKADIQRPRDLDGKTLADFGGGFQHIATRMLIQKDGGKGDFKKVVAGAQTLQAVEQERADFAELLSTWEGIEAEQSGYKLRYFDYGKFGIPTTPALLGVSTREDLIKENPKLVRAFVQATQKGYQWAIDHPQEAAQILVKANPQAKLDSKLAEASQALLSKDYWPDATGGVGHADMDKWQSYLDFIIEQKLVYDGDGKPYTQKISAPEV